jgi:hypothetical protein
MIILLQPIHMAIIAELTTCLECLWLKRLSVKLGTLRTTTAFIPNIEDCFLDFDFQALLGQVDTITPHANRRLKSEDPVSTDKYLEVLKEYVAEHNVRE